MVEHAWWHYTCGFGSCAPESDRGGLFREKQRGGNITTSSRIWSLYEYSVCERVRIIDEVQQYYYRTAVVPGMYQSHVAHPMRRLKLADVTPVRSFLRVSAAAVVVDDAAPLETRSVALRDSAHHGGCSSQCSRSSRVYRDAAVLCWSA